jgi:hypothetical protein
VLHPVGAASRQSPDDRAADQHCPRAERERDRNVGTAPDTAVHQDLDAVADRVRHLGKGIERGDRAVELAAAVVRDDDGFATVLRGEDGVLCGENALGDDRHAGVLVQPFEIAPGQAWVDERRGNRRRHHAEVAQRRGVDLHPVVGMEREPGTEVAFARAEHR